MSYYFSGNRDRADAGLSSPVAASQQRRPSRAQKAALSPAVVVIPEAQPHGIRPAPTVGLHGQAAAVPVDALGPALRCAPPASVGDAPVLVACGAGI